MTAPTQAVPAAPIQRSFGLTAMNASADAVRGILKASRDPLRMMIFWALVLNVSRFHQAIVGMKALRPGLLLVAGSSLYALADPRSLTRANLMNYWPLKRVVLLGFLAVCSAIFGLSFGRSMSFMMSNYSKTIVFCFLVALSIRSVADLLTMVWAYAVSSGILAYFALLVFTLSGGGASKTQRLSDLYTYDANDVCVVMMIGLGCIFTLLPFAKGRQRTILIGLMLGVGGTIARSGSRGGFLGLAAFGLAALFFVNSISSVAKVVTVGCVGLGLALFAPAGYWDQIKTIGSKDDYNMTSLDGRKFLIQRGIKYMLMYPVFGVGINNFDRAECTISGMRTGHGGVRCSAPHNSYIQAGSELGFPGLAVFASIMIGGVISLLRLRGKLPKQWKRGNDAEKFMYGCTHFFACGLTGFAVSSFFVSFAWLDILYIQLALISGLYVSIDAYRAAQAAAVPATLAPAGAAVVPVPAGRGVGWRSRASAARLAPRRLAARTGGSGGS